MVDTAATANFISLEAVKKARANVDMLTDPVVVLPMILKE